MSITLSILIFLALVILLYHYADGWLKTFSKFAIVFSIVLFVVFVVLQVLQALYLFY